MKLQNGAWLLCILFPNIVRSEEVKKTHHHPINVRSLTGIFILIVNQKHGLTSIIFTCVIIHRAVVKSANAHRCTKIIYLLCLNAAVQIVASQFSLNKCDYSACSPEILYNVLGPCCQQSNKAQPPPKEVSISCLFTLCVSLLGPH